MGKIVKIFVCLFLSTLLMAAGVFTGCTSSMYTEEQHIQRIRERAEERYLGEESAYTSLEVYPIYNEYDELKYALIEFEPQGFLYVAIGDRSYPWKGMYTLSTTEPEGWMPYRVKEGEREDITDEYGNTISYTNREFFRDESGHVIIYQQSHFKVAGIENERCYLLGITSTAYLGFTDALIPAVKRGEQYLNLVDGEVIDYKPGMESATYAIGDISFIPKPDFDL